MYLKHNDVFGIESGFIHFEEISMSIFAEMMMSILSTVAIYWAICNVISVGEVASINFVLNDMIAMMDYSCLPERFALE